MVTRWFRRTLRRYGIELLYKQLICPEYAKTIRVDESWRAQVTIRRTLVFLDVPEPRDLCDVIPVDPETDLDSRIDESPDAEDIDFRRDGRGTRVYWKPREFIIPYALYVHERSWSSPGANDQAALYTEFRCDIPTGIVALEMTAPVAVEAGIAFKRPSWRRLNTERSLVKYALTQLEQQVVPPAIGDKGQVTWKIAGPSVGDRYVCVVFTVGGVARWQLRLRETSLAGKAQRFIKSLAPS